MSSFEKLKKERIEWIDIAKGFTILLVIVGHSPVSGLIRGVIVSFHMPLFFIISCMTFKPSLNSEEFVKKTEKAFSHLILSAVGIYLVRIIIQLMNDISILQMYNLYDLKEYIAKIINVFVFGSGIATTIGDTTVAALGIPWFLMVLFFGRSLFDYLHLKLHKRTFYCSMVICSIIGVFFGMIQWLPFSFDIALAIQPLFLFGQFLKKYDMKKNPIKICFFSFFIWTVSFIIIYLISGNYMELAFRRYSVYPLCFICAGAGTIFVSSISQFFSKLSKLSIPIKYLGKNSMKMLWIQCFDIYIPFTYNITSNDNINTIIRIFVDIIIFIFVSLVSEFIRKKQVKEDSRLKTYCL